MKKLLQILISLLIPFVASAQIVIGDMTFYPNWDENGYYDGTYYLSEYTGTESVVTVPETVTSDGITYPVTEIGGYAFHDNNYIMEVILSSSIKKIGAGAFSNCKNLTSIDIPASIKLIEENSFFKCSSLHSITLNEGIEEIGKCAFFKSGLCSVNLPNSLKRIGEESFGHTSLDEVYISKNIEYIGEKVLRVLTNFILIFHPKI